jgi:arylformamidase
VPLVVDLSHPIGDGTITYPGLPAPKISDYMTRAASAEHYADGVTFHIAHIEMVANTGTYLDTPAHRYADGEDLAAVDLAKIANLPALTINASGDPSVNPVHLEGADIQGKAVLLRTDWCRYWGSEQYASGSPFLTSAGARALVEAGAELVGIDSLNIDDVDDLERPAHSLLLGAGIPIVEHLTGLDQLPADGYRFFAVPPKVEGMGTFPVRAFAIVD